MNNETYNTITEAHLWRYFAGQVSNDELDLLAHWVKSNDEHKAEFQRVKELFYKTKYASFRNQFDDKQAFKEMQQATMQTKKKLPLRPWKAVAAMVTIILGSALFFIVHGKTTNNETFLAYSYRTDRKR